MLVNTNTYIPKELINIILEYDGRIKYRKGKYVNIIHIFDPRKNIINQIIAKKLEIINSILFDIFDDSMFYFEFGFDIDNRIGLCFDYNFSYANKFEICYYDTRNGIEQIRTYL
uniref:Uncharacterized protein n=1 Tax=viral metagenome TaxID=1070528 RepID=A0A6C0IEF4_9ZZZZ